jgi:hypothetical protein
MLPGGTLSLHGYNVTHGYFSGTCTGSKHLPFEQSCALVERFVASAKTQLANLEAFQTKLRTPTDEAKAWICTYQANPRGRYYTRVRTWQLVDVAEEVVPFRDGTATYSNFWHSGNTKWEGRDRAEIVVDPSEIAHSYGDTLLQVCTKANRTYADWLEHEAKSLRRYIAWQTERVATWKEMPLFPIGHKDKLGFEPTAAPY